MDHRTRFKKNTVILYHADCADGFGAAWAARKKFKDKAVYIAVPPNNRAVPTAARGANVYTLDYSFPAEVMPRVKKQVASLTVIDHHATNEEAALRADNRLFDRAHSGAVLAWKFFHPKKNPPRLLRHVEDADLWKFSMRYTREITEAMMLYDMNFKTWDALARNFENGNIKKYVEEGKILMRLRDKRIGRLIGYGERRTFEGLDAIMVNSPFYVSEIGHSIVKHGTPVAIMWSHRDGKIVVSLRSDGKKVNVAELAERYGGGGHPAAAGFTFIVQDFLKFQKSHKK